MSMQLGEATIGQGASGAEVKQIQQILAGQGYAVGAVDGIYGPQTQAAVQAFQKSKGLIPDGIVGPLTWSALQVVPVQPSAQPAPVPVQASSFSFGSLLSGGIPLMAIGAVVLFSFMGKKARR